jgi:hypothetical protein
MIVGPPEGVSIQPPGPQNGKPLEDFGVPGVRDVRPKHPLQEGQDRRFKPGRGIQPGVSRGTFPSLSAPADPSPRLEAIAQRRRQTPRLLFPNDPPPVGHTVLTRSGHHGVVVAQPGRNPATEEPLARVPVIPQKPGYQDEAVGQTQEPDAGRLPAGEPVKAPPGQTPYEGHG